MKNLNVSHTWLPPLPEYTKYLRKLWKSHYLTNNGEYIQKLEKKLATYWGVNHVVCMANGTLATEIAIRAMGLKGRINISAYSYISTLSVPLWLGNVVRIHDLDHEVPAPAIVTHVYGIPCITDVSPVIYDASHAFMSKHEGKSVLQYGDCSIISFHATKIFQTIEGGALVTNNDELAEKARWMRNFGHNGQYKYFGIGINCKMNEFEAAMGLCMFPRIKKIEKRYKEIIKQYNKALNYSYDLLSYYPIFYRDEAEVLRAIEIFEKNHIYPRRYFYPALNTVFGGNPCPVAENIAETVLCLPLYYELTDRDIKKIIRITKQTL